MERFNTFTHDEPGHGRRSRPFDAEDGSRQRSGFGRGHHRGPDARRGERHFGGFGPGSPLGPGRGFGRRPVVRRGDVRLAILALLVDGPMHGYQVMQELRERSGGAWAPSAGSIYPTLQQLEDEGLVRGEEQEGRHVFTLTEAGTAEAAKLSGAAAPWNIGPAGEEVDVRQLIGQVAQAAVQVYQVGTPQAVQEAQRILAAARRSLYQLLATDSDRPSPASDPSVADGDR